MPPKKKKKSRKEKEEKNTHCGFTIERELGSGSFGTVYKAIDPDGNVVALKVPHKDAPPNLIEATLQATLHHPNIIRTLYVDFDCDDPEKVDIGTELATTDLFDWGQQNKVSLETLPDRIEFLSDIECALHYLAANRVAHFDLKPENVLLVEDAKLNRLVAKLIDFGVSERLTSVAPATLPGGTLPYMAPELLCTPSADGYPRTFAVEYDVWSFGVLAFHVLFATYPFPDADDDQSSTMFLNIVSRLGAPSAPWRSEFSNCTLPASKTTGPGTLKSLLGDQAYAHFTAIYGSKRMKAFERFFMRIFTWRTADRTVDMAPLREQVNATLPPDLQRKWTPCKPAKVHRVTPSLVNYTREEKKSAFETEWLITLVESLPKDVGLYFMSTWNRLKKARGAPATEEPSLVEAAAIISLVTHFVGLKTGPKWAPLRRLVESIENKSAIHQMQHAILDELCFNTDGQPWKCRVSKLPTRAKKNRRPSERKTIASAERASYSTTSRGSIAVRVKTRARNRRLR